MAFEQRPKISEGESPLTICVKNFPGRQHNQCKDPEANTYHIFRKQQGGLWWGFFWWEGGGGRQEMKSEK